MRESPWRWQCWQTASSTTAGRKTVVDLRDVDFIDGPGEGLLADMHRERVQLDANTPLIRALVEQICRTTGCARVEEQATRSDALVCTDSSRHNSSSV